MEIKFFYPIVVILNLIYFVWIIPYLVWPIGIFFYIADIGLFSLTLLLGLNHWERKHDKKHEKHPDWSVDIFIATYNESIKIVEKTLRASKEIIHKNKTIYILDDGNRKEIKKLAERYGAKYLARVNNKDSKAGNLNNGLKHSKSDFILTLDADQVPEKHIFQETIGYFEDKSVAYVTTRQRFDIPEKDFNNAYMFYEHMQTGKNADNCAISCGSGVIYRRSALEEINGFQTWNLVEDLYTSYVLNQKGYKSVYVNNAYTTGLAPQDLANIYKQRGTWAVDSLRIFFKKNPLLSKNLSLKQKLHYLEITYSYFVGGIFIPLLFIFPIYSLLFNIPIVTTSSEYLLIRFPGLIAIIVFYFILNKGNYSNQYWAGLWPVYLKSIFLAFGSKKIKYKVTEKIEEKKRRINLVLPQLLIVVFGISAIFVNSYLYGLSDNTLINSFWILFSLWLVYPVIVHGFTKTHKHTPTIHLVSLL